MVTTKQSFVKSPTSSASSEKNAVGVDNGASVNNNNNDASRRQRGHRNKETSKGNRPQKGGAKPAKKSTKGWRSKSSAHITESETARLTAELKGTQDALRDAIEATEFVVGEVRVPKIEPQVIVDKRSPEERELDDLLNGALNDFNAPKSLPKTKFVPRETALEISSDGSERLVHISPRVMPPDSMSPQYPVPDYLSADNELADRTYTRTVYQGLDNVSKVLGVLGTLALGQLQFHSVFSFYRVTFNMFMPDCAPKRWIENIAGAYQWSIAGAGSAVALALVGSMVYKAAHTPYVEVLECGKLMSKQETDDLRADNEALVDLKHENPLLFKASFSRVSVLGNRIPQWLGWRPRLTTEMYVSAEMASQLMSQSVCAVNADEKTTWARLNQAGRSIQTVNTDRYGPLNGQWIKQDTIVAVNFIRNIRMDECQHLPFPRALEN